MLSDNNYSGISNLTTKLSKTGNGKMKDHPITDEIYITRRECIGFSVFIGVAALAGIAFGIGRNMYILARITTFLIVAAASISIALLRRMSIARIKTICPEYEEKVRKFDQDSPIRPKNLLIPREMVETATDGRDDSDQILKDYDMAMKYAKAWRYIIIGAVIMFIITCRVI